MSLRAFGLLALLAGGALAQGTDPAADFIRVRQQDPLPAPLAALVDGLEASRLKTHMAFLSDPLREGRGLGSRGLAASADYIEGQLRSAGIPALGTSHRQAVPLRQVQPGQGSVRLNLGGRSLSFQAGRSAILPPTEPGTLSAPCVYVGLGIQEPALGHDDYQGLDVRGKVVVFREGIPPAPLGRSRSCGPSTPRSGRRTATMPAWPCWRSWAPRPRSPSRRALTSASRRAKNRPCPTSWRPLAWSSPASRPWPAWP